ncbi:MAG TPA: AAA family ATPase [Verrucomicrobiae bacterium]|nr:AAA family ATPase [Verrucomicrobiae bacterium]
MATQQYPVLIWRDAAGTCTAALVGDLESAAACAPTKEESLRQLKELLDWRAEHEPWNVDPDLIEPVLIEVKVEVRPQYRVGKRMIPCPETLWLRVPCVTGKQESGLWLCLAPHLQVQFNFQDAADLQSLVAHYVKDALQGFTPTQLAACLPPHACHLEEITIRIATDRVKRVPPANRPELKILFTVADPLLHDLGRKRGASAAYGRDELAETLARKLGTEKACVLLVGEPGVGKTTVLLDAAKRLARIARANSRGEEEEDAKSDKELRTYRCWRGSGGRMIAGMRYLGEWEERCEEFVTQLSAIEGIFCAENLLELLQVGGQGPGDSVAAFLLPYLQRGELRMTAEATPEEVEACRRLLPGLLDVFQIVPVPAFDEAAAEQVLNRIAGAHAAAARLEVDPGVSVLVRRLFRRFQPYAAFPGPAANFIRNLCNGRAASSKTGKPTVTTQDVIAQFVKQTGLPEIFLRDDLLLSVSEVRAKLAAQIIGQPDAIGTAARLIASIKAGLTDPARPLGVLLFCGPTGVGKTALAKSLVEYCFDAGGVKDRLVRLDMSEYAGWGAAQRLLQNPQGRPADWIERVRRQPFCMVLFDEIEKAAPEVFDVLLGLLDEGRVTDRFGRVTWFRSAIIIMTSNLGANAPGSTGFAASAGPSYESEVTKFFRPEFFNRLDGVITFQPLKLEQVEAVTRKELSELAAREGLAAAGIQITWTDRLVRAIAREGYDHRFGARPLQRVIEKRIVVPLARWRVVNAKARAATLLVDLDDQGSVVVKHKH